MASGDGREAVGVGVRLGDGAEVVVGGAAAGAGDGFAPQRVVADVAQGLEDPTARYRSELELTYRAKPATAKCKAGVHSKVAATEMAVKRRAARAILRVSTAPSSATWRTACFARIAEICDYYGNEWLITRTQFCRAISS